MCRLCHATLQAEWIGQCCESRGDDVKHLDVELGGNSDSEHPSDAGRSRGLLYCQLSCGCLLSLLTHLYAGTEFFQKNFSAA